MVSPHTPIRFLGLLQWTKVSIAHRRRDLSGQTDVIRSVIYATIPGGSETRRADAIEPGVQLLARWHRGSFCNLDEHEGGLVAFYLGDSSRGDELNDTRRGLNTAANRSLTLFVGKVVLFTFRRVSGQLIASGPTCDSGQPRRCVVRAVLCQKEQQLARYHLEQPNEKLQPGVSIPSCTSDGCNFAAGAVQQRQTAGEASHPTNPRPGRLKHPTRGAPSPLLSRLLYTFFTEGTAVLKYPLGSHTAHIRISSSTTIALVPLAQPERASGACQPRLLPSLLPRIVGLKHTLPNCDATLHE